MERILLVEDEAINRRILAAFLHRAGYAVDEAEDGKQALEKLAARKDYALVVTDRNMPNMDGLTLARHLKDDADLRNIPILMQTAANAPEEMMEGIRAGVYYYLTKPYKEETLLSLVRSGIRERRQYEWFEARSIKQQDALNTFTRGEFKLRTPEEAQGIAFLVGSTFPRPELAVSGLYELLLNAIEHGNLGIGYAEKAKLLAAMRWEEEIVERLKKPENLAKKVVVEFAQNQERITVSIKDEGVGFDWWPYLEIEPARATLANGRGIAKANQLSFDGLLYQGKGNSVEVTTKLGKQAMRPPLAAAS